MPGDTPCFPLFRHRKVLPILGIAALGMISTQAFAQSVPGYVNPAQVEKRIEPTKQAPERLQLNVPAPVDVQQMPPALRAQLQAAKFFFRNIVIEGNTVYSKADLAASYQDQLGKTISLLDARVIANSITAYYRNHGYILTQAVVPTQDVTGGTLRIRVIEGYIGNVAYQGDVEDPAVRNFLDTYSENIKALRPANLRDLERYMLLMNDLPGSAITGLIRPSAAGVGSADLVLTVHRRDFEAIYQFDNRGSKYIGPYQETLVLGANSLINSYDHTQLRLMTVHPVRELGLVELQHDEILDNEGTKLTLMGSYVLTRPGDSLKPLRIVGESGLFEAKVSHPFIRTRNESMVGRVVFDVRNTNVDIFKNVPFTRDRLRVLRVGSTFTWLDSALGSDSMDVLLSKGLNIFDATDVGNDRSNPFGKSDFTKLNFDYSRLQPLPENFSVLFGATGQYAFQPLLTDEQFAFGGSEYARAWDPAEALGDSGIGTKLELRYDGLVEEPYFDSYQLFTFVDAAETFTRVTVTGSDTGTKLLSSTGLGARMKLTNWLSSTLEADFPIVKPPADQTKYRGTPRVFFTVTARF